jgi:hypothetical protein
MTDYMTDHETTFKYIISYTSEHNSIAEWCWKHFVQWRMLCYWMSNYLIDSESRSWILLTILEIDYQLMSESLFWESLNRTDI